MVNKIVYINFTYLHYFARNLGDLRISKWNAAYFFISYESMCQDEFNEVLYDNLLDHRRSRITEEVSLFNNIVCNGCFSKIHARFELPIQK